MYIKNKMFGLEVELSGRNTFWVQKLKKKKKKESKGKKKGEKTTQKW
jgi:hypothetical protein